MNEETEVGLAERERRALAEALAAFAPIRFAVLYGSAADRPRFRDVDVALMVDRTAVPPAADLDFAFRVERALAAVVPHPVDVRIINEAPLPFAYNVSRGRPLLLRDAEAWYQFREYNWDMWLDFRPVAMKYIEEMAAMEKQMRDKQAIGQNPYLSEIADLLRPLLAGVSCRVYLFGSRATGTAQPGSDVDVAVDADEDVTTLLSQARFVLEESTVPYKVDLVDLRRTDAAFRRQVIEEGVLWWQN